MKKTIQVGTSDFMELIEGNHYFIDKSFLIKEFIENRAKVILIPRPRRFGKTLNMNMLKYFFDVESKNESAKLFKGLKIENDDEVMKLQGKYPVIFISFKNIKFQNYEDAENGMRILFSNLYRDHFYLLESDKLNENDKKNFKKIVEKNMTTADIAESISMLMRFMKIHYGRKVMVFIDEYDVPIQESYVRGYYDNMISLMQVMLTCALKDNNDLEKALLTGILRVAKESIFSGLNNLEVDTIFSSNFNDKFGFTVDEVKELLQYYDLEDKTEEVRQWYNGYIFGGKVIYNPWSLLNYIKNNKDGFIPYWINSSSNDLIKKLLVRGDENTKKSLEELIKGNSIEKVIDDHIVMKEVEYDDENLWSFLTLSGYLKPIKTERELGELHCTLKIPNNEVLVFYKNLIKKWFSESLTTGLYNDMLNALINGDIEVFEEIFTDFVVDNMSYFDTSGNEPEKVYHAFVLGMLVSLGDKYEINSNKESGYGRYDVMIIPKDTSKLAIIIEFKKIRESNSKSIEKGIEEALNQIEENQYERELKIRNINNILKLAIVFKGKKIKIKTIED
ncbi:MAG: AAA family ATPase [Clostridium sp.]